MIASTMTETTPREMALLAVDQATHLIDDIDDMQTDGLQSNQDILAAIKTILYGGALYATLAVADEIKALRETMERIDLRRSQSPQQ